MEWDGSNWDSSIILSDPREPLVLTGDNDEGLALELLFFPSEGQHSDHRREHYLEGRFLRSAKINFNVPFIWMAGLHQCPNRKQVQQRSTRPVKERTVSSDSASRCFQNERDFLNSQNFLLLVPQTGKFLQLTLREYKDFSEVFIRFPPGVWR